ncbi:hypothetical protein FSP39_025306 [Pinctada imbricata]|uniref:B box-type domain-containing protein n=1 Tax=Pinctada imbricata TaxID=66713 RepID=A0AA88YVA5_PINIB|nr:hypothetical protein FSP39_025306 [Pinctada imbricata]
MAESHQWAVLCSKCNSSAVYNCNKCDLPLCPLCKDEHNTSEDTKHHGIVNYSDRQKPITRHCTKHPDNILKVWCETCDGAVCMECVTSVLHRKHDFVSFDEKLSRKRQALQSAYEKTVVFYSEMQNSITDLESKKETVEESFNRIESDMNMHADHLHREVNKIHEDRIKKLKHHRQRCLLSLNSERKTLEEKHQRNEIDKTDYENILRSNDVVAILEFKPSNMEHEITTHYEPLLPKCPSFHEGGVNVIQLDSMFGRVSFEETKYAGKSKSDRQKVSEESYETIFPRPRSNTMPNLRIESYTVNTECNTASLIICMGHGQTWIAVQERYLKLFDKEGNSSGGKHLKCSVSDAAVTSSGDILLLDRNSNNLCILARNGSLSTIFTLSMKPYGICQLSDDTFAVTFRDARKVFKYGKSWIPLMEFNKLGLKRPCNLAQNKVNKHIYIIDKTVLGNYKDPGRLVTCTENGEFIREYTGPRGSTFTPVDVCSDEYGKVFITDYSSNRVHILSKDGVFKRYLEVNERDALENPCRIDINDSMYVWISEKETAKVKVIRYT